MKIPILIFISLILNSAQAQQANSYFPDYTKAPSPAWTFTGTAPIYSSPVLNEGLVFFGSLDSNLYVLDAAMGTLQWKYKTGGDIRSTVAIKDNIVFLVSGDGCLYALDKNTRKLLWKFQSRGDRKYELYSFADYVQSSPVVIGNSVFFGSGDGYVYAVNTANGKKIWEYKTGSVVHSTPAVSNDQLFIGSFDGYLYALDPATGKEKWKIKSLGQRYFPIGEMQGSPVVFHNMVFAGSRDFNLYARDANKGHGLWNRYFSRGWAMATPVIRDSILYVGTMDDRLLLALNPYNGNILWQTDMKFNVFGAVAFSENMLYAGTLLGRLYGVDIRSGKIIWQLNNKRYEQNRLMYLKEDDSYRDDIGRLMQKEENILKMYYDLGAIFSTPVLSPEYLIVTSTDGSVYAFKR
jgi:outer membrane protein assembly factor BamB